MERTADQNNKRRKTSLPAHQDPGIITDLPESILASISSYLPKPSVALFASSLTAPSASWQRCNWMYQPSTLSKWIVSSYEQSWDELDFVDIVDYKLTIDPRNLVSKLNDCDVGAVLVCIDAPNNLKKLKITGCVKVVGECLEPLLGSTVIEQIDLSLIKEHDNNKPVYERWGDPPNISERVVIPILDSILHTSGSNLKHLQLPGNWGTRLGDPIGLRGRHCSEELTHFLARYNDFLSRRPFNNCCMYSSQDECQVTGGEQWFSTTVGHYFGVQSFTCYSCSRYCCRGDCTFPHTIVRDICISCFRFYCNDCASLVKCESCSFPCCKACINEFHCDGCSMIMPPTIRYCAACVPKRKCHMCNYQNDDLCLKCSEINDCSLCVRNSICQACTVTCDHCGADGCGDEGCIIPMLRCENDGCERANCVQCVVEEGDVVSCEHCKRKYCTDCRGIAKENTEDCDFCGGCRDILDRKLGERKLRDYKSLGKLTIPLLKEKLKEVGLPVSGKKDELIARLLA